nr:serine hydrolase domain-containing protein [Pseudoalteromonas sp. S16_S37]
MLGEHFKGINAAIAIINNGQSRHYFFGDKVNEHALFEVGSLTKPMVAKVVSDLVRSQQWQLSMPISVLAKDKAFSHHQYTLRQLLTHTSGLPRLPNNLSPMDINNPYARYDTQQLISSLKKPVSETQTFEYSNYGYGVLGYLLTEQMDSSLEVILNKHLFKPLNMPDTVLALSTNKQRKEINLVGAVDYYGKTVTPWQFDSLAGAGAVVSSLHDMQQWVMSYWHFEHTNPQLHKQMIATLAPLNEQMSYGWMRQSEHVYWHNGKTDGYCAMVIFSPNKKQAVIVLAGGVVNVTQIGQLLFNQVDLQ